MIKYDNLNTDSKLLKCSIKEGSHYIARIIMSNYTLLPTIIFLDEGI